MTYLPHPFKFKNSVVLPKTNIVYSGILLKSRSEMYQAHVSWNKNIQIEKIKSIENSKKSLTVGCLPVSDTLTVWLETPFASVNKAKKVLPSLLDIELPFPLENCHYQIVDFHHTANKTVKGLAIVVRKQSLLKWIEKYQNNGMDPVILDHEGLALWEQALETIPALPNEHSIFIYADTEHITIVNGYGSRFKNACSMEISETDSARQNINEYLPETERFLYSEIEQNKKVRYIGCGVDAASKELISKLHSALSGKWTGTLNILEQQTHFLHNSLIRRALNPTKLFCNLRNADLTHNAVYKAYNQRINRVMTIITICGLILILTSITVSIYLNNKIDFYKQQVTKLAQSLAPNTRIPYGLETSQVKQALTKRSDVIAPFINAFKPGTENVLISIMNYADSMGINFESLTLSEKNISLTGTAENWQQCDRFEKWLKTQGFKTEINTHQTIDEERFYFSIDGKKDEKD
jgi:type II secretory pathway component PulL